MEMGKPEQRAFAQLGILALQPRRGITAAVMGEIAAGATAQLDVQNLGQRIGREHHSGVLSPMILV